MKIVRTGGAVGHVGCNVISFNAASHFQKHFPQSNTQFTKPGAENDIMALGSLDKRLIRTRCQACAHHKRKCQGGRPCMYCSKQEIECVEQIQKTRGGLVILNYTPPQTIGEIKIISRQSQISDFQINRMSSGCDSELFVNHFFTFFITKNELGIAVELQTIISQFQTTPSLSQVISAIGALDISRKYPSRRSNATLVALKAYRASVVNFQSEIQQEEFLKSDAGLWSTLFLGIFELMFDVTGEGFVKHILYGTSKILQLRGPKAYTTGQGRSFFLTVRVLEISRALIYTEPTFLHQESWKIATSEMWEGDLLSEWHPKEALFDLMIECSALSQRVWEIVDPECSYTEEEIQIHLLETAVTGMAHRNSLELWNCNMQVWNMQSNLCTIDSRFILAKVYYHAISIYLSGVFDYRFQFNNILNPTLSSETLQFHVEGILSTISEALGSTNLSGLLFFFPLRVAGARAVSLEHKDLIIGMLKEISKRSFVVADAFIMDLENLWGINGQ